jgi:hypothetical protein
MLASGLFALAACSGQPDTRIDMTFDPCAGVAIAVDGHQPDELSAVDTAVALWNESGPLRLIRDESAELPRLRVSFDRAAVAFRGVYDDERGIVIINRELRDERTRAITVAHELGHAFGLWHASPGSSASVMKADNVDVAPTATDVANLQTLWASCASSE